MSSTREVQEWGCVQNLRIPRTSLLLQGLRLHDSSARNPDSTPGPATRSHML